MKDRVFVRGKTVDGKWGSLDVMDLDDDSFRAFVLSMMIKAGLVCSIIPEKGEENPVYQERRPR